jgi:DNA-binding beta-propeller fold protein YncE
VDLEERKLLRTLPGFREPQGIAYDPSTDTIYVANAGDGSVRLLHGEGLTPAGAIQLGEDADDIRIDIQSHRVLVGYGRGLLRYFANSIPLSGRAPGMHRRDCPGLDPFRSLVDVRVTRVRC